jgi:hypothetical protein
VEWEGGMSIDDEPKPVTETAPPDAGSESADQDQYPWRWSKGQSGNPAGKPPGTLAGTGRIVPSEPT